MSKTNKNSPVMNPLTLLLLTGLLLCLKVSATGQNLMFRGEKYARADSNRRPGQNVRVLFWNVENLYDSRDDTLTQDEEFSPQGSKRWSYNRYRTKLDHLAKGILAAGGWDPPGIIGLCEIENQYVLNKLVYDSPLKRFGYRIIHRDSPDPRGVDVALLYRKEKFIPLHQEWIRISFPFDTAVKTRDILYVKGILLNTDTVHIFVNHWPSRRGGEVQSAPRRNYVAQALRESVDSLLEIQGPYILIMGDFNDEPDNESLRSILRANPEPTEIDPAALINLMGLLPGGQGSHKYREHWGMLDQFIISGTFLKPDNTLQIDPADAAVFRADFLLEDDPRYLDKKPKRTYLGPKYRGGFSDHLPIVVDVVVR